MKIAILVAMDKELNLLLNIIPEREEIEVGGNIYYKGMLHGHEIVTGKCGIGKVNAALNTYLIISNVHPDLVINSGVAGGVDGSLGIGSILIADSVAYHDVWCGPGTEYGAADGFPQFLIPEKRVLEIAESIFNNDNNIKFGLICSGDKFIHKKEEVDIIKHSFEKALAVDMESAAIAQTCVKCGIPFAIIRVMSDTPGSGENVSQYINFWSDAPQKTFDCIASLLKSLK